MAGGPNSWSKRFAIRLVVSRFDSADQIGTAGREVFDSVLESVSLRRGES